MSVAYDSLFIGGEWAASGGATQITVVPASTEEVRDRESEESRPGTHHLDLCTEADSDTPRRGQSTTHIEHHFDSRYKYHELKPRPEGAQMPSAFLCFVCALVPPLWEARIARPRLRHWDEHFASPAEKELAMAANPKAGWPHWIDTPTTRPAASATRASRDSRPVVSGS